MEEKQQKSKSKFSGNKQSKIKITKDEELLEFLINKFPNKKRRELKSLLTNKQIAINYHNISQYNHVLKKGDELVISWNKSNIKDKTDGINIIYEDNFILVVEKDSKLLSVANEKEKKKAVFNLLIEKLREENPKNQLFVTHRLDMGVSGLMVFAKSKEVQTKLVNAWKNHEIKQKFDVIVEGRLDKENGTIKSYLKENAARVMYSADREDDGMIAITHFDRVDITKHYSLLAVNLETKRKNQLRVHLMELGYPVVGDKKYGAKSNALGRLGVHASTLSFTHPDSNVLLSYQSVLPERFTSLFNK